MSFDDGKARGKDLTRLSVPNLPLCHWSSQFFDLRAQSSTDVLVLLPNQPVITLEQIKLAWEIHRSEDGSQTLVDTVIIVLSLTWHKTFSFYLLPAGGFSGIMIYIANKVYVLLTLRQCKSQVLSSWALHLVL